MNEDADYLKLFLNYLTANSKNLKQDINTYQFEINKIVQKKEIINFNTLVNQSYFFQWMILNKSNIKFKFMQNNMPFFSSENNYNFTKQSLSQSYILILNNPFKVYTKIKNSSNQDQEVARNLFLNLDQKAKDEDHSKVKFSFANKGWLVHTESWTDPNVISSLRGKIISQKEICNNTFETLSDVVLHLIQSGIDMDLNYDLIEDFIKRNPIADEKDDINISNKEKKFLSNYVDTTLDLYDI